MSNKYQLKISVEKRASGFVADMVTLPGAPPIGTGENPREAIGDLIIRLAMSQDYRKYHNLVLEKNGVLIYE